MNNRRYTCGMIYIIVIRYTDIVQEDTRAKLHFIVIASFINCVHISKSKAILQNKKRIPQ